MFERLRESFQEAYRAVFGETPTPAPKPEWEIKLTEKYPEISGYLKQNPESRNTIERFYKDMENLEHEFQLTQDGVVRRPLTSSCDSIIEECKQLINFERTTRVGYYTWPEKLPDDPAFDRFKEDYQAYFGQLATKTSQLIDTYENGTNPDGRLYFYLAPKGSEDHKTNLTIASKYPGFFDTRDFHRDLPDPYRTGLTPSQRSVSHDLLWTIQSTLGHLHAVRDAVILVINRSSSGEESFNEAFEKFQYSLNAYSRSNQDPDLSVNIEAMNDVANAIVKSVQEWRATRSVAPAPEQSAGPA